MSLANQTVIVAVLAAIGWGLGVLATNNEIAAIGGAVAGAIGGLALCDWLRKRFASDEEPPAE